MKALLIKWLAGAIFDALITALKSMSTRTSNGVDDKMIAILDDSKDELLLELKQKL